jgi:hypothetical protein
VGSWVHRQTFFRYSSISENFPTDSTELAQAVVDAGAVPLLIICLQAPEVAVKRIAASTLSDISKHTPEVTWCFICLILNLAVGPSRCGCRVNYPPRTVNVF